MAGRHRVSDRSGTKPAQQSRYDQRRNGWVFAHGFDQVIGGGLEGRIDVDVDIDPLALDTQDRIAYRLSSRTNGPGGFRKEDLSSVALLPRKRCAEVDDHLAIGTKVGGQVGGAKNPICTSPLDLDSTESVCIEFCPIIEPQN